MNSTVQNHHSHKLTFTFALLLVLIGISVMGLRGCAQSNSSVPVGDQMWKLILTTQFNSGGEGSVLHHALPMESAYIKIMRQSLAHPGQSVRYPPTRWPNGNSVDVISDHPGEHQLVAEFVLRSSEQAFRPRSWDKRRTLSAKQRESYISDAQGLPVSELLYSDTLSALRGGVDDSISLQQDLFEFVHEKIILDPKMVYQDSIETLSHMRGSALAKTMTFITLARAARIPARLVSGVVLREAIDAEPVYWAELYNDGQWQAYDLEQGYAGELPPDYLALGYGRETISYFDDPSNVDTRIDIELLAASAGVLGEQLPLLKIIDLTRLPVSIQQLLSVLLILPFGALITQIFRQIVGVKSFGTFSAALLALAMVYADWITVLVILSVVGVIGLSGRALIAEGFTRIARLVIMFTLVTLSMAFAVSLMVYLDLSPSANAVLLPVVILVTLIDRIYATHERLGLHVSVYRTAWTALLALICYWLFTIEGLSQLVLHHPEIHCFTLTAILLVSIYNIKTLSELPALRWLREPRVVDAAQRPARESDSAD